MLPNHVVRHRNHLVSAVLSRRSGRARTCLPVEEAARAPGVLLHALVGLGAVLVVVDVAAVITKKCIKTARLRQVVGGVVAEVPLADDVGGVARGIFEVLGQKNLAGGEAPRLGGGAGEGVRGGPAGT